MSTTKTPPRPKASRKKAPEEALAVEPLNIEAEELSVPETEEVASSGDLEIPDSELEVAHEEGVTAAAEPPAQHALKMHKLATLFPPMSPEEYATFKASIKEAGRIHEPIVLIGDAIIDGRHRYMAAQDLWEEHGLDIPYQTVQFDPEVMGEPLAFVRAKNIDRRHLTAGQLAAMGLKFKAIYQADTKPGKKAKGEAERIAGDARDRAARQVGVSGKSIDNAARVHDANPALFEQLVAGEVSLNAALNEVKREEEKKEHKKTNGGQDAPQNPHREGWVPTCYKYFTDPSGGPTRTAWIYDLIQEDGSLNYYVTLEDKATGKSLRKETFIGGTRNAVKDAVYQWFLEARPPVEVEELEAAAEEEAPAL